MAKHQTNSTVATTSSPSSAPHHRPSVEQEPVTSILQDGDIPLNTSSLEWNPDEEVLAALGYKPEFKREFSLWSTFCVSFAVLGLLPSFGTTLYYGMGYAGTAGMTWGWLVAMVGIQAVAASMAELCSSMPTSGGLYYASAVLAPEGWGPFAAWVYWVVELVGADYGRAVGELWDRGYDSCFCEYSESGVCADAVSDVLVDGVLDVGSWGYGVVAYAVDCQGE
ncbi:hypothetical protein KC317_g131 [Hortaea werneckii]|nr:hypothetical protein KC317_g131 [Hortaea werneckii]